MDTALSPAFARTTYNGESGVHHNILPVNVPLDSVAGVEPLVSLKGGTTALASVVMGDYWDVLKTLLGTNQQIGLCEIYKVDPDTGEGTFLYGFDLARVGSSGSDGIELSMMTLSFKLVNGRLWKLVLLDTPAIPNQKDYAPYVPGSNVATAAAYLISDDSPVYGRGNAYPFGSIAFTTKTSDALRSREGLS